MAAPTLIARLFGPDKPGLVARVAGWIYQRNGNIHHADQHMDVGANIFFQRVEWTPQGDAPAEAVDFQKFAVNELGMQVTINGSSHRPKVALMVSKIDHCFHDTILRFKSGELAGELVCVLSNHPDLEAASRAYSIPFHYCPVQAANKTSAEATQLDWLRNYQVDLVVMARYMQILSDNFLRQLERPVINIHHSFLPAFAGGKPYHQAYERGVKLIGATAHYATLDLDEGPIIHQDVTRINHRNSIPELVRKGKDLEKSVFAQAIRLHLDSRILVYNNKTVIFD
jgi:formyltetrahydrofolate deformylase